MKAKIDWNRLTVFVEVVESGSFTSAARRLKLPISSVSRSVARLEDELGVLLLRRTTRRLALTEVGDQYFQRVRAAVSEAREATEAVAGHAGKIDGTVRMTAPPGLSALPRVVTDIMRRHPGLYIDLTLTLRPLDLVEEGMDLALRGGTLADSSLMAQRIAATDFYLFAAPSYLAEHGTPRTPADLARHEWLQFRARGGVVPWRLEGPGVERLAAPKSSLVCDDFGFLQQVALAGGGIALLLWWNAGDDVAAGRLVRVLPRHRMAGGALYVVWPPRLLPARVKLVRDLLVEGLGKTLEAQ